MYGDPHAIRARARQLRTTAAEIEVQGRLLLGLCGACPWTGFAADAARARCETQVAELQRCATAHTAAADALDAHAAEVERLQELISRIEETVAGLVGEARDRLAALAGRVGEALGGLIGDLVPDPVDRLLDRFVPPPAGHRDWLDVRLPGLPVIL